MAMAALESERTDRSIGTVTPRSDSIDLIPMGCSAALTRPYYAASPLASAITDCVLLHVLTVCLPSCMTPPLVDLRVDLHPAKSVSDQVLIVSLP